MTAIDRLLRWLWPEDDAVERARLEDHIHDLLAHTQWLEQQNLELARSNAALRGQITKLRKRLEEK